jgi:uncharacterized membrane protein
MGYHHSAVSANAALDHRFSFGVRNINLRFVSIDLLRASAMVIMVIVHFCENLAGYTPKIAGVGAPMFMFLSGVSYRLWLEGQHKRNTLESEITRISVRRGLFLFGLGFAFNVLVWSPEDVFNWDILTLIGTGLILLAFARDVPPPVLLVLGAGISLLAPVIAKLAGWEEFWTNGYFDPDLTFVDVTLGFLATGYFPIIPWIAFPLVGFAVAQIIFHARPDNCALPLGQLISPCSLVLISARSFAPADWLTKLPKTWTMFPPSLEYLLAIAGFTIFAFVNSYRWMDMESQPATRTKLSLLGSVSKYSLSFYLLHHVAHLWPLWAVGLTWGQHPHDYWGKATNVPTALALAATFLVASFFVFRLLDRYSLPTAEKLMRWLCD